MSFDLIAKLRLVDDMTRPLRRATSSIVSFGSKVAGIGTALAGIAGVAGAAGATMSIVKMGASFDSEMSKVMAVTNSGTDAMKTLRDQAKMLGETTVFSATEAAEGMSFLGMAGFKTKEIMSAMPGLLDLAAAGALDLGRASDIASNVMSGFGKKASEMGHISDVLALSAANANTSVEQMGMAMSYVAPVASGMGVSMEEVAATVGKLSDAGIQGERAGTALRGMIGQLSSPTKELTKKLAKAGLSTKRVNPRFNSLADVVETLSKAGFTAADAMDLVGLESGPGLASLLSVGSSKIRTMTDELKRADGAANRMATTMNDNLGGEWKEFTSKIEGVSLSLYDVMSPMLSKGVTGLSNLITKYGPGFTKAFEEVVKSTGNYLNTNYFQNSEWLSLNFADKVTAVLDDVKAAFDTWYDNSGNKMMEQNTQKLVNTMVRTFGSDGNMGKVLSIGVDIGKSVGTGILSGLNDVVGDHPLLTGAMVGIATPGPAPVKVAAGAATAFKGLTKETDDKTLDLIEKTPSLKDLTGMSAIDIFKFGPGSGSKAVDIAAQARKHKESGGLSRVPYNNFPAFLHRDEAVLPRAAARDYRNNESSGGGVTVTGNTFNVRQDSDINAIATQLYRLINGADQAMGGAY